MSGQDYKIAKKKFKIALNESYVLFEAHSNARNQGKY